jgi:hypothetical protein
MENAMKRIFTAIALVAMIGSAQAGYRGPYGHHGHHAPRVIHHHGGGWNQVWVPLIIGGVVGAAIANKPAQAEPIPAPMVVVPQSPNGQIILQNTSVVCPEGTAPFFNIRNDRYGRTYYEFDTCK